MFRIQYLLLLILVSSCGDSNNPTPNPPDSLMIKACDLSSLPEIESKNITFYNASHQVDNMLNILKSNGMNTVRIRLWHTPVNAHSGFEEVKQLVQRVHQNGLKVWLTVHYSDTWADPGHQSTPNVWQALSFPILKDSVFQYTKKIALQMQPEYIQIGNEINPGMLLPNGNLNTHETQFKELLASGISAVRTYAPQAKIMLHYAGHSDAYTFFNKMSGLDYDIIGLSYYPIWHGKDLTALQNNINSLISTYNKDLVIAETAYPFSLDWNDWTNNIVGLESQLISSFPATPQGQKDYLLQINDLLLSNDRCLGYAYWGTELVAFNGSTAIDGSPWENQALFDFNNQVVIAATVLSD